MLREKRPVFGASLGFLIDIFLTANSVRHNAGTAAR
jgi:hypothetical protein